MLDKLVPKLSPYAVFYWDGFLGICLVLVGLGGFLQKVPHASGLLLSGFGLSAFSASRRCVHHIGNIRRSSAGYWPDIRKQAYPAFVFSVLWLAASWVCFRYAALDFEMTSQWARWILRLTPETSEVHRVSVSYPSRWSAGEFRNCRLGRPHYLGDRWPELGCDGRGSQGEEAVGGAHAFVMDVRFSGEYKVPTDERVLTWTCQSSITGTGELTCKDWQ